MGNGRPRIGIRLRLVVALRGLAVRFGLAVRLARGGEKSARLVHFERIARRLRRLGRDARLERQPRRLRRRSHVVVTERRLGGSRGHAHARREHRVEHTATPRDVRQHGFEQARRDVARKHEVASAFTGEQPTRQARRGLGRAREVRLDELAIELEVFEPHESTLGDLRERRARQSNRPRKHRQKITRQLCATRRGIRLDDETSRAHAEQAREHGGAAHEAAVGRAARDRAHHSVTDLDLVEKRRVA